MTVRFFMLQCHYASTLDFSNAAMQAAEKGLERLMAAMDHAWMLREDRVRWRRHCRALEQRCYDAMNDDLNTPVMIAELFEGVRLSSTMNDGKIAIDPNGLDRLREVVPFF
jgi:cysteinyl-tRNA synthetase